MGSVNEEITRIAGAKVAIEGAIEECGVDVPADDKIDTYAEHIKAIPAAVFSQFNSAEVGGTDSYIQSISQTNGVVEASTGGLVSSESSGLMSATDKTKLDGIEAGAAVNVQSDWSESDTTSDAYISNKPANLSDFNNDLPVLNIGTKSYNGSEEVTIEKADLGLSNALIYRGTSSTEITDGGTQFPRIVGYNTRVNGDVVFYNNCEFVWNGSAWEKLGDDVTYKVVQDVVNDPTSDGEALEFISGITQDADGVIYPTKKSVQVASYQQAGVVSTEDQSFYGFKTFHNGIKIGSTSSDHSTDNTKIYFGDAKYTWIGEADVDDSLTFNCGSSKSFKFSWGNTKKLVISKSSICPADSNETSTTGISLGTSSNRFTDGYFSAKVQSYGGFYETSDDRLKNFYNNVEIDLDKLAKLPKKYFTWKKGENDNLQIGTSAQAVQQLYPELVHTDENGTLSVAYDKLSVIALKGIDVLNDKVKSLEKRLERLEKLMEK